MILLLLAATVVAADPVTVELSVKDKPLQALLIDVADQLKADLVVRVAASDEMRKTITIDVDHVPWTDAVGMFRASFGIDARLADGRLTIDDAATARQERMTTRWWDIRSIIGPAFTFHPAPNLSTPQPGGTGSRLLPPIEAGARLTDPLDLIRGQMPAGTWSEEGASIRIVNGCLVATHDPAVLATIPAVLASMERALAKPVLARLWKLDAVPAGEEVIPAAGIEALIKGRGAPLCSLLTIDGIRDHVYAGEQRHFIADADVNGGTPDPIISVLQDGLSLELVMRSTEAGVAALVRLTAAGTQRMGRLGYDDMAGHETVPIDLPDRQLAEVRGSWLIPEGGGCILRSADAVWLLTVESPKIP